MVLCERDEQVMAPYFSKNPVRVHAAESFSHDTDLFAFAIQAKAMLQARLPASLCTPVLRVDIMRMQSGLYMICNNCCRMLLLLISGKLVVNEFESLEAMIDASGQSGLNSPRADSYTDARVSVFLEKFWISTISNTISSVQSRI